MTSIVSLAFRRVAAWTTSPFAARPSSAGSGTTLSSNNFLAMIPPGGNAVWFPLVLTHQPPPTFLLGPTQVNAPLLERTPAVKLVCVVATARSFSQVCCAMLVGIALTVLVLELAVRRLDGPAYVAVRHAEFTYFTWFIAIAFVPSLRWRSSSSP
jgi:hypothetical protein